MTEKKESFRKQIWRKLAGILAFVLMVGMMPGFVQTAYASTDDDDDSDDIEYRTDTETVSDGDGNVTTIETYYENGQKTGTTKTTYDSNEVLVSVVSMDADDQVVDTVTREYGTDDEGHSLLIYISSDGDGSVYQKTVEYSTTDEAGNSVRIYKRMDGEGNLESCEETTTNSSGVKIHEKRYGYYGDGSRFNSEEEYRDNGELSKAIMEFTEADGSSRSYVTEYGENENVIRYTMEETDADGIRTSDVTEYDENGEVVRDVKITTNAAGTMISKEEEVKNEDGTTTRTVTEYDEEGNKTGSTDIVRNESGLLIKEVTKDKEDRVVEVTTTDIKQDEAGNSIITNTVYNGDNEAVQVIESTMSPDWRNITSVVKDGEGNVLESYSATVTVDEDGNIDRIEKRMDADGKVTNCDETMMDAEGNVTGTISAFYVPNEDGSVTEYSTEKDGEGNEVRSLEITRDQNGNLISDTETICNEDGTKTSIETTFDGNGNITGSTEKTQDENGAIKTVTKDAEGRVTGTQEDGTDSAGNNVITDVTYDENGAVKEKTVTTMNPDMSEMTEVTTDGNDKVIQTITANMTTNADGSKTRITTQKDGDGNVTGYSEAKIDVANRFTAEVETGNASKPEVEGLTLDLAKSLCTADELSAYEAGGAAIELSLKSKAAAETAISANASLVSDALQKDENVSVSGAKYFDISLYKSVGGSEDQVVTDTGSKTITITMEIPADMINSDSDITRTFYIVRVHNNGSENEAKVLPVQRNGNQLTFGTNQFSVYAIVYHDEPNGQPDNQDDSQTNSGSKDGGNGSVAAGEGNNQIKSPKTGERMSAGMLVCFGGLLLAAAGSLISFSRSTRRR